MTTFNEEILPFELVFICLGVMFDVLGEENTTEDDIFPVIDDTTTTNDGWIMSLPLTLPLHLIVCCCLLIFADDDDNEHDEDDNLRRLHF